MSIFINCCVMATPNPDALNVVDQSTRGDNELDIELDETSEFEKKQAEETTKTTSFIVELAKQSATDAVGVAALYHGNYIVVEDVVTDSLIHRYNAEQKDPALVVRVGDGIRRVNAVEGDPARMKEEANSTQNVVLFCEPDFLARGIGEAQCQCHCWSSAEGIRTFEQPLDC